MEGECFLALAENVLREELDYFEISQDNMVIIPRSNSTLDALAPATAPICWP